MASSDKTNIADGDWPHAPADDAVVPAGTTSPKAGWLGNLAHVKEYVNDLLGRFRVTGGHTHSGVDGDGPKIVAAGVTPGTDGEVLKTVSGASAWATDTAMTNPMTTQGDIIYGGVAGAATRKAVGTAGQALVSDGTNPVYGGAINMADAVLTRPEIKDYAESLSTNATSGAAATLDLTNGNVFDVTLTANCTFTFSNPPATGRAGSFTLILRQDATGSRTATWPASVKYPSGTAPTLSTAASAIDVLTYTTLDGGTTYFGFLSGKGMA